MQGKAANCHVLPIMIREIKVSSDCFGCVFVISFYVTKAFSESVTKKSSCFTNVQLFAMSASYAIGASRAINDIGGGTRELSSDLDGSLVFRHFLYVTNDRTGFA